MEVEFLYARFLPKPNKNNTFEVKSYVQVENLSFRKQIQLVNSANGAILGEGKYIGFIGKNRECWEIDFTLTFSKSIYNIPFIIKYLVGGETFIDDNQGKGYSFDKNAPEIIIQRGMVYLIDAQVSQSIFMGRIGVRNVAFEKEVRIHYTTDRWTTTRIIEARFLREPDAKFGISIFEFKQPLFNLEEIDHLWFYISYRVNNETFWDNNFYRDYSIQINRD